MPFFRYAVTFFNVKNLMKFSYKKSGHTIFDEMCTAIFADSYISRYYKHKYVLLFVNV